MTLSRMSLIALAGFTILMVSPIIYGSSTRVVTLGDQNRFVEDQANIWLYPQKITRHTNRFYLDLGSQANFVGKSADEMGNAPGFFNLFGTNADNEYHFLEDPAMTQATGAGVFLGITPAFFMGFWVSDFEDDMHRRFLTLASIAQSSDGILDDRVLADQPIAPEDLSGRIRRPGFPEGSFRPHRSDLTATSAEGPEATGRKLDTFFGFDFDTLTLGGRIAIGRTSAHLLESVTEGTTTVDTDIVDYESMQFGLGLGASIQFSADTLLDVGFEFNHRTLYWAEFKDFMDVFGANSIGLDSRMRFRVSRHWWLVPSMQLKYDTFGADVRNARDTSGSSLTATNLDFRTDVSWTHFSFDLGMGSHMKIQDQINLFLATGFEIDNNTIKGSSLEGDRTMDTSTYQLPYFKGGLEGAFWDWMTLRAGFAKYVAWQTFKDELYQEAKSSVGRSERLYVRKWDMSLTPSTGTRSFYTFLGAGLHYKGWGADLQIDPMLLFSGPSDNNMGGYPLFNRITLSYQW